MIGAAHAGWKGALGGVLESVVAAMAGLGARPERVTAALGPCIAQASYEVGPELALRFQGADPASPSCFAPVPGSDRLLFDLKAYVASRLRRAGVERIEILPHDTARRRTCSSAIAAPPSAAQASSASSSRQSGSWTRPAQTLNRKWHTSPS